MEEPAKIEKVTDEALSRSIISSVIGILLCMVCLVGTTWAWYSLSVESGENETFGAKFDFNVTVAKTDTQEGTVTPENGQYSLEENGTYTVTLTKTEGCTAKKGFCRVIVKSNDFDYGKYYYEKVVFSGESNAVNFTVTVAGQYVLNITPMLGTPANPNEIPTERIDLTPDTVAMMPPYEEIIQAKGQQQPPEKISDPEEEIVDEKIVESTDDEETTEGNENVETPADSGTTEPEEKSEEVISEQSQTKPETQVEPPVNTETTGSEAEATPEITPETNPE